MNVSQLEPAFSPAAAWVGSAHPFDLHEVYLCFRSPAGWQLDQRPTQAELWLTADSRYKLWVNGQFVARGPARCYPQAQAVDRLDITAHLRPGPNTLAMQLYQPGYSHFAYLHRGAAGLLAQLVVAGRPVLVTDPTWRVRRDPSFADAAPRVSIYSSGVEERDLRRADNWTEPGYDDSGWAAARLVAPLGGYPWTALRWRSLPLLVEGELPLSLLESRRGAYPADRHADAHLALREGWFAASPAESTPPLLGEGMGEGSPYPGADWFTPNLTAGQAAYWLFDLGRDHAGQGWVEIEQAGGEEWLSLSYAEKIRHGQLVISDPQTYCRVRLTDRFRLRPGDQTAESFALRGGRYLLLQLVGPTGPEFRFRPHFRASDYPLEMSTSQILGRPHRFSAKRPVRSYGLKSGTDALDITRSLTMSDPELIPIVAMCEATFRACLQDGFVDSTWRESSQWVGDALPQSLIMAALTDDVRPLRRVIELAAQGAYPDGVLPSVLPGEVHAYTIVDYNFIWVELLRLYRQLTGDNDFVAEMWPALLKMLARFHQDLNAAGLLISQPGRRLFLDWAPLSRREPSAVYNLHYVLALQQAAELANGRGLLTDEASLWLGRAAAVQAACRTIFWQQVRWWDDPECTTYSQLAAALAVLTGTARPDEADVLLDAITARSLDLSDEPAPDKMVLASPFMHHYLFEALRQGGRAGQVVEIICRRWGRWVAAGYPTTWENWNVDFPDGSQCHAFSAHPLYHLAEISRARGGL